MGLKARGWWLKRGKRNNQDLRERETDRQTDRQTEVETETDRQRVKEVRNT